jgi:hypothetical protein
VIIYRDIEDTLAYTIINQLKESIQQRAYLNFKARFLNPKINSPDVNAYGGVSFKPAIAFSKLETRELSFTRFSKMRLTECAYSS